MPFLTGQFTNTGAATSGAVNPFQTIQREEVGTILKVTPQINEGDAVMLKIEHRELQRRAGRPGRGRPDHQQAHGQDDVLIEDGGIVVLGGLIERQRVAKASSRVPFLGRIPLIGELFKVRNGSKTRAT